MSVARLPWFWGSMLVVTLALVAFTLAVTTLILVTRTLLSRQRRRHVSPSWELLESSSSDGHLPEDRGPWHRRGDAEG
jgi:hypothetical protein